VAGQPGLHSETLEREIETYREREIEVI
jgi:hypothetical protein